MDSIVEIIIKEADEQRKYFIGNDSYKNGGREGYKLGAEIWAERAIGFADFIMKGFTRYYDNEWKWQSVIDYKLYTTEELFIQFLNNK